MKDFKLDMMCGFGVSVFPCGSFDSTSIFFYTKYSLIFYIFSLDCFVVCLIYGCTAYLSLFL